MMSAAVLNPHHAGQKRSGDISRSSFIVVQNGTQQHAEIDAAVTVNRYSFQWSLSLQATRWLQCDMIRTHRSTWLMEETQSGVKGQVNPSQTSGDRLHFPGVEASGDWSHEVPPGIGRPIAFLRVHQEFLSRGLWKIIIIG